MHAKFVHVKINACFELAPVSKKHWVNKPLNKIDARAFNRGNTLYIRTAHMHKRVVVKFRCHIFKITQSITVWGHSSDTEPRWMM